MGFFNSVLQGAQKGVTGGDNKMDLQDYLSLASLAMNASTGNIPGVVAQGAGMVGDATDNEMLQKAGDLGSMVTGITGATGAISGVSDAVPGATDVISGSADGVGTALSGVPDALAAAPAPEAFNAVTGTGDIMAGVPASLVPPPTDMAAGGSSLGDFLSSNGKDMAETAAGAYADYSQAPSPADLEVAPPEDFSDFSPTYMTALRDYLSQSGIGGNQYTSQFNQYGG